MGVEQAELHALILGASGISGWSLLNQLRQYPSPETWQRISGTTNRPFDISQSGIPTDDRLRVYSGIDLTKGVDNIVQSLKVNVENVETVTHLFFTAYIDKATRAERKQINTQMLENSVRALDLVAPGLRAVILQTGGKGYGMEYPVNVPIVPPLREDLPRIPRPWRDEVFYYSQYDILQQLSQSGKWTFAEIRPDGIIGFLPGNNPMNMAQGIALYLSVYRAVHGKGAEVPFPGTEKSFHTKHSDTFQDILSKMEIFVALKAEIRAGGPAFNIANEDKPITWASVWPGINRHFGLVGVGPRATGVQQTMEEFVKSHRTSWEVLCEEFSLQKETIDVQQWGFTHFMLVNYDFDRWYDLSRARAAGFSEAIDTVEAYKITFERMAAAHMIPKQYLE